ncbi:MAG: shikimate kinase [Acidobacteriota bacterium]
MEGYYDDGPLVALDRPVTLAGFLVEETRAIGQRAAALLGLPVHDIDRAIEHEAGTSVWNLIWRDGEARYRTLERQHVAKALAARPLGVITLGDGVLVDPAVRQDILNRTDLLVLDLDLLGLFGALKATKNASMDFWHPLHAGPLERIEQVRPFYDARRSSFDDASSRITATGQTRHALIDRVVESVREFARA